MAKAYGASLYISYARADEKRLGVVAQLYEAYQATWVNLKVDKKVVKPRESFKDFIEELGKADCIIVLFSDAYFKSFYCMLELARIMGNDHAKERVFSVFLEDFRLDNQRRALKSHWETKLNNWQAPYEKSECIKGEYGSKTECQSIVDSYDDIFECFAYDQAYDLVALSEDSFKKTLDWSKDRFFQACKGNPIFEEAIKHLKNASNVVKTVLQDQINDKSIVHSEENIIAWLVQHYPTDFLDIIAKAQAAVDSIANKKSLAGLLKQLLPLLFDPSYVSFFNAEKDQTKIISIPYATKVSAEVLMASSDQRGLELYVGLKKRSDVYFSMPGKYHLGSPPEGGEAAKQTLFEDTQAHLMSLTGDSSETSIILMQNQLFDTFVNAEKENNQYSEVVKQRRINKALDEIDAHYYWIMPLNKDNTWADFAKKLAKDYPRIIVLQLDNNDENEEDEANLFGSLHKIISH